MNESIFEYLKKIYYKINRIIGSTDLMVIF